MVKFRALIHKETGTIIRYEEWLRAIEKGYSISIFIGRNKEEKFKKYRNKDDVLFGNDFEIIYESEFTLDELYRLYGLSGNLVGKIATLINEKEKLFTGYGVEV